MQTVRAVLSLIVTYCLPTVFMGGISERGVMALPMAVTSAGRSSVTLLKRVQKPVVR
uniref:hypothetical protein n=1 Tax=Prevotella sp. TaxID=59823 RepID=UPI004027FE0D